MNCTQFCLEVYYLASKVHSVLLEVYYLASELHSVLLDLYYPASELHAFKFASVEGVN